MRPLTSRIAALFVAGLATVALAACGDESEQALTFTLKGDGKTSTFTVPESADPGLTEITLENEGKSGGDMQLIRVEGDHSPAEVVDGLDKAMKGEPFPDWFFAAGGMGAVAPDRSQTVTQVLEPGTYYAFDTEGGGPPNPKDVTALEVSGEASDEELDADGTISAFEYGFKGDGLTSGGDEIVFENSGAQPHHVVYAPLSRDTSAEDVRRFFESEKGKPPFEEKETKNTAVIEGGESQLVDLDLKSGRYVLLCFITDRQGGPPHIAKGMIDEVEVE